MSDRRPTDRIGNLLEDVAVHIEHQVAPPDVGVIRRRSAHRRRRRILVSGTAAVVVAALVAAGVGLATHGPGPRSAPTQGVASYPVHFDNFQYVVKDLPAIKKKTASIPSSSISSVSLPVVTPDYAAIAFGAGRVWVLESRAGPDCGNCGALAAINPSSLSVAGSVPLSSYPDSLSCWAGSVWVLSSRIGVAGYDLTQVDPSTLAVQSTTALDAGPGGVTPQGDTGAKYAFVTVWGNDVVATFQGASGDSQIFVITATSRQLVGSMTLPSYGPVTALDSNSAGVWVGTAAGWVVLVDPGTGSITNEQHLGTRVVSLAPSDEAVWVTLNLPVPSDTKDPHLDLLRLDPESGGIEHDTGLPMLYVVADGSSVWALGTSTPYVSYEGLIGEIDPRTAELLAQAQLPTNGYQVPDTVGVGDGAAWVINDFLGTLTKVSS